MSRTDNVEMSLMGSWEAVLLSCRLLRSVSMLINYPLQLHINHVGVGCDTVVIIIDHFHDSGAVWFCRYCSEEADN